MRATQNVYLCNFLKIILLFLFEIRMYFISKCSTFTELLIKFLFELQRFCFFFQIANLYMVFRFMVGAIYDINFFLF